MEAITVTVSPSRDADGRRRYGSRGALFDVTVDRTVVRSSPTPLVDAARALLADGVPAATGLTMRHAGSGHDALVSTVGAAAGLTVHDSETGKPVFKRWQPDRRFDGKNDGAMAAGSAEPEAPAVPTAEWRNGVL